MYGKAKGAPTKLVNLLNQCGLSMSYRWTSEATHMYSEAELTSFSQRIESGRRVFYLYDNLRISFKKETQRVNNQTHGDNGTSITAVEINDDRVASILEGYGEAYQKRQLELRSSITPPELTFFDFIDTGSLEVLNRRGIHLILKILLDSEPFKNYQHRDSPFLLPPPAVNQLPTGKIYRTRYTQLATLPIEEASYEGNLLVIDECLKFLCDRKKPTVDQKKHIASIGLGFVGDQLTCTRIQTLKMMRRNDDNSFDRLQEIIDSFGLFHALKLLADKILSTHRGTRSDYGFSRTISYLDIKGLPETEKHPYFHTVDVLIHTEVKTRILDLWLWFTGKSNLEEIFDLANTGGPKKLLDCATKIYQRRATTTALKLLEDSGRGKDEVLEDVILQNRDMFLYVILRDITRQGDVGAIEALLPTLALAFKGANCNNYAKLITEYMHWRKYEAPPGVA